MTLIKRNYVLIDFENTQSVDTDGLSGLPVKIVIFVGHNQKSLSINLVKRLLEFNGCAEIYESAGIGKNALDFQLSFYAGRIFEREPEAFLHIVSKDKGFDPLVAHIKSLHRSCSRVDNFSELPFWRAIDSKGASEKDDYNLYTINQLVDFALSRIGKIQPNARPRKIRTLKSSLHSHFQKQLDAPVIDDLVETLIKAGHVVVGESDSVTFNLTEK